VVSLRCAGQAVVQAVVQAVAEDTGGLVAT
jgi:hypothetical protein